LGKRRAVLTCQATGADSHSCQQPCSRVFVGSRRPKIEGRRRWPGGPERLRRDIAPPSELGVRRRRMWYCDANRQRTGPGGHQRPKPRRGLSPGSVRQCGRRVRSEAGSHGLASQYGEGAGTASRGGPTGRGRPLPKSGEPQARGRRGLGAGGAARVW
jgi:hypothetical protein